MLVACSKSEINAVSVISRTSRWGETFSACNAAMMNGFKPEFLNDAPETLTERVTPGKQALVLYQSIYPLRLPPQLSLSETLQRIDRDTATEDAKKIGAAQINLSRRPGDASLWRKLFEAHLYAKDYKNAEAIGARIKAKNPRDLAFRLQYARMFFWEGKKERAEMEYKALIVESPNNAFLYYELGNIQTAIGKLREAEVSLRRSLALYPNAILTKKALAEVLAMRGKFVEARVIAVTLRSDETNALAGDLTMAKIHHYTGRLADATTYYQKTLQQFPHNEDALSGLAECLIYQGDYIGAQEILQRWRETSTDDRIDARDVLFRRYTAPAVSLKAEFYSNSIEYSRFSAGADFRILPTLNSRLNVGYYYSDFRQAGVEDIHRHSVFAAGEYKLAKALAISGGVTVNSYDNDWNSINGRIELDAKPAAWLELSAKYDHTDIVDTEPPFGNAIYNPVATIGAVEKKLTSDNYSLFAKASPVDRLAISGQLQYGAYSDGNQKTSAFIDVDYTLLRKPMLQLGYTFYYLNLANPADLFAIGSRSIPAYYDPSNFQVHTARLSWTHEVTPKLRYGLEERLSYIPGARGIGQSLFGFLELQQGASATFRLDARHSYQTKSLGRTTVSGSFQSVDFVVSYEHRF